MEPYRRDVHSNSRGAPLAVAMCTLDLPFDIKKIEHSTLLKILTFNSTFFLKVRKDFFIADSTSVLCECQKKKALDESVSVSRAVQSLSATQSSNYSFEPFRVELESTDNDSELT